MVLKELRSFLYLNLFLLGFFLLARIAFLLTHVPDINVAQGVVALLQGLRFDFAAIGFLLLIPFLLTRALYLKSLRDKKPVLFSLNLICFLFALVSLLLVAADFLYYPHASKKLGYEAFVYLDGSLISISIGAIKARPLDFIVVLPLIVLLARGLHQRVQTWVLSIGETKIKTTKAVLSAIFLGVTVTGLLIIGIRGGLQRVPLRVGDSFLSENVHLNNAILNSGFVVFRSLGESKAVKYLDSAAAMQTVYKELKIDPNLDLVSNSNLPLLQKTKLSAQSFERKKYNVVIILLESWTSKYLYLGEEERLGVTPVFNQLAREGVWFSRSFASGFRTTSGLFSTLTAQPDQLGIPVMRRKELSHNFASLSRLLKEQGYYNLFVHGGKLDFDNLENMLRLELFDKVIGEEDFDTASIPVNVWGVDDGPSLERLVSEVISAPKPFFTYAFTVTTHAPYEVPKGHKQFLAEPNSRIDGKFINTLHYSDAMLGKMMDEFKKQDFFKDTIFVFTGDHTHHMGLDAYQNQRVPLLLYAPHILKPQVRRTVATQTDILPTLADILGLPHHASLGKNLWLYGDKDGGAYFVSGTDIGYADDLHFVLRPPNKDSVIVYTHESPEKILKLENPVFQDYSRHAHAALAFYQLSNDILVQNKIYYTKTGNK
ncbi:MAG: LTA synthase family protein [Bdellovibrionia bacterium]